MSQQKKYFITGTDTDIGKTFVSCSILSAAMAKGLSTAAIKPVAAGVTNGSQNNQNEDVLALMAYCSIELAFEQINPVCFDEAIAPHIASAKSGKSLDARSIAEQCQSVISKKSDLTLIEGAGGWKVPLSEKETMADLGRFLDIPVILVVGMRLGCLNHALLTAQSIQADGLRLAGWVANRIDPKMPVYQENLDTLKALLPAPLLAEIPWLEGENAVEQASGFIDMERILQV